MPKAQTTVPTITVLMDTPEFSKGFVEGLTGEYARFGCMQKPPNEGDIVEIIRNLCEISQEGWLRESLLRHDAGLIAGWLSRPASAWGGAAPGVLFWRQVQDARSVLLWYNV